MPEDLQPTEENQGDDGVRARAVPGGEAEARLAGENQGPAVPGGEGSVEPDGENQGNDEEVQTPIGLAVPENLGDEAETRLAGENQGPAVFDDEGESVSEQQQNLYQLR